MSAWSFLPIGRRTIARADPFTVQVIDVNPGARAFNHRTRHIFCWAGRVKEALDCHPEGRLGGRRKTSLSTALVVREDPYPTVRVTSTANHRPKPHSRGKKSGMKEVGPGCSGSIFGGERYLVKR